MTDYDVNNYFAKLEAFAQIQRERRLNEPLRSQSIDCRKSHKKSKIRKSPTSPSKNERLPEEQHVKKEAIVEEKNEEQGKIDEDEEKPEVVDEDEYTDEEIEKEVDKEKPEEEEVVDEEEYTDEEIEEEVDEEELYKDDEDFTDEEIEEEVDEEEDEEQIAEEDYTDEEIEEEVDEEEPEKEEKLYVELDDEKEDKSEEDEGEYSSSEEGPFQKPTTSTWNVPYLVDSPPDNMINYVKYEDSVDAIDPQYVDHIFHQLDSLTLKQMKEALQKANLPTQGRRKKLRKMVRDFYRSKFVDNFKKNELTKPWGRNKTLKHFDFLVVIDFECTCEEIIYDYPHEIIEFPAVLIDVKKMSIVDTFQAYVKPTMLPILSEFCKDFCNLTQETVDEAHVFKEAYMDFISWCSRHRLGDKGRRFCFVTDGSHDIWKFFQFQCQNSEFKSVPHHFRHWCNIQKVYEMTTKKKLIRGAGPTPKTRLTSLHQMLEYYCIEEQGAAHTGIDDSINIAKVVINLMKVDKVEIRINERMCYTEDPMFRISKKDNQEQPNKPTSDIHIWRAKLPLKLRRVTRDEFLSKAYLDCESCEEDED